MTETHERRITYEELRYVLIACQTCAAEICVDLENEYPAASLSGATTPTPQCSICGTRFNVAVAAAVHGFFQWAWALRAAGQSVAFRIREPEAPARAREGGR
jgi:hypothetical protein